MNMADLNFISIYHYASTPSIWCCCFRSIIIISNSVSDISSIYFPTCRMDTITPGRKKVLSIQALITTHNTKFMKATQNNTEQNTLSVFTQTVLVAAVYVLAAFAVNRNRWKVQKHQYFSFHQK